MSKSAKNRQKREFIVRNELKSSETTESEVNDMTTQQSTTKSDIVYLNIQEAKKMLYLTPLHIRSLCRQHKIDAYQDKSNRWHLNRASVMKYKQYRDKKKQMHKDRIENDTKQPNIRPTTQACTRIRKKVQDDKKLTDSQRKLFISRINEYEKDYDRQYLERYAKK